MFSTFVAPYLRKVKWHYLDSNRQTHGGFPTEEFVNMVHEGKLNSRSYVWNGQDVYTWMRIEKVFLRSSQSKKE